MTDRLTIDIMGIVTFLWTCNHGMIITLHVSAVCHFSRQGVTTCLVGSACEDTYSFRHILSPTNEVQQFIVSSFCCQLGNSKTLP